MFIKKPTYLIIVLCLFTSLHASRANELIEVNSRDDVLQRGLFIAADNATHTILLFTGGQGRVKLKSDGVIRKAKGNFVIRTRNLFLDNGMNVVIVDAPSDRYSKPGMFGGYRSSGEHMVDLTALLKGVKKHSDKPIWLSGTSRGSESVAYAAIHLKGISGIILTASVTEENAKGEEVTSYELDKITIPVFIGAHIDDGCWVTPPSGAEEIKSQLTNSKSVEYKIYSGGDEPISKPCKAKSQHGFLGIEDKVLMDMIKFIRKN